MPENLGSSKHTVRLAPAIGDWTRLKPPAEAEVVVLAGIASFGKLSEKALAAVHRIHYRFAENFTRTLRDSLKVNTALFAVSAEQLPYGHFKSRLPEIAQFNLAISEPKIAVALCLDLAMARAILYYALGGTGTPERRALTEIEITALKEVLARSLSPLFTKAWQNIFPSPEIMPVSSSVFLPDPTLAEGDPYLSFEIMLSLGTASPAVFRFGYPYPAINALQGLLETVTPQELNVTRLPAALFSKIQIPVTAELGTAHLTTGELATLEVGDAINLEIPLSQPATVKVGKEFTLAGRIGVQNAHRAIEILPFAAEEISEELPPLAEEVSPGFPEEEAFGKEVEEEMPALQEEEEFKVEEEEKEEEVEMPEEEFTFEKEEEEEES